MLPLLSLAAVVMLLGYRLMSIVFFVCLSYYLASGVFGLTRGHGIS